MKIFWLTFTATLLVSSSTIAAPPSKDEIPGACKTEDAGFNTEEGGCLHFASGLVWALAPLAKREYSQAETYCSGLTEGSQGGWRLPTARELQDVAANRQAFSHFEFRTADFFWAKSSGTGTDAWTVVLASGDKAQGEKATAAARVVCVRSPEDIDGDGVPDTSDRCNMTPRSEGGRTTVQTTGPQKGCSSNDQLVGPQWPRRLRLLGCKEESEHFKTGSGGCVHLRSGLEWSRVSESAQPRKYAARYCESLVEGTRLAHQDWRLPTSGELDSISGDNLAVRHFKFDVNRDFWSSTITNRTGSFFSYRPNGSVPFEEYPQVIVNLLTGRRSGVATQMMTRGGDVNNRTYREFLAPANEEVTLSAVCVRSASGQ